MFEETTEKEARKSILEAIAAYCDTFHNQTSSFFPGQHIPYASRNYDRAEMVNLGEAMLDFWLTYGPWSEKFEKELAEYLGVKHCVLVNSGSSANLLAFMTLTSPLLEERAILPGDEVITVACGFPTTVAPIMQYGAVPVFVDVTLPYYNINCALLEQACSPKTKAILIAHTLGNPFDLSAVLEFCDKKGLWLIEDNCDALGSEYLLDGQKRKTGTFGHLGTSSFYPPHHITMGEGGAVYTNDPLLKKICFSLRDWGRDCVCPPGHDNLCQQRFSKQYGSLPFGYDHKYVYSHLGYNLKVTDMQAAIGCAQLQKLPAFVEQRKKNFIYLREALADMGDHFILPEQTPNSDPSWFGFPLTINKGISRNEAVRKLESKGIQTRMLFAGNLLKHPCLASPENTSRYRYAGDLINTDRIMRDTFWIGVHPGLSQDALDFMAKSLREIPELR